MKVVSVIFKENGKEYYFKAEDELVLEVKDKVVVDTIRGSSLAFINKLEINDIKTKIDDLMPVIRKGNNKDLKNFEENIENNKQGFIKFNKILEEYPDLNMSLVSCEYSLDQTRILFMYVSDERVDFRELLKRLATEFKKRIELKQIGARDKAKIVGGLGPCGMEVCCKRFLRDFENISINMAKNQMLSLNPTKVSGLCGRLLCCLKYENEEYSRIKKMFPKLSSIVKFENEDYKVSGINILNDTIKLEKSGVIKVVNKEEITW